jgi:ATP:corrinoid adenosyltransferase
MPKTQFAHYQYLKQYACRTDAASILDKALFTKGLVSKVLDELRIVVDVGLVDRPEVVAVFE